MVALIVFLTMATNIFAQEHFHGSSWLVLC